jgi:hypothetical protein
MVYQKREELEAELHISTRENCLQSPMLKKDTSWATISSTPLQTLTPVTSRGVEEMVAQLVSFFSISL